MEQRGQRVPFGPLLLPRARTGTLPNGPRNILPQRSVPAGHSPPTTEASVSVRVRHPRPESPVCLPSPSRLALSVHSVGSSRTCPEPGGIFPDQGSIENTLSPASSAGGFFTTGLPGVFQKLGLHPVPPGLRGGTYLGGGIIYTLRKHICSLFTCFSSAFLQPRIVRSVGSETMKTG